MVLISEFFESVQGIALVLILQEGLYMASETKSNVLGTFLDEGAYTLLFGTGQGAVVAAHGMVGGNPHMRCAKNRCYGCCGGY